MNSSGIILKDPLHWSLSVKTKSLTKMAEPEQFEGRIIFMSMFNDIIWWSKDNERECNANFTLVSYVQQKIFTRKMVTSRTWDKRSGIPHEWKSFHNQNNYSKMYWCRILENSQSRTILHDTTYWQVLTICRASDMLWVFFSMRWQINWPERLDSREHQNWNRIGSHNQLLTM